MEVQRKTDRPFVHTGQRTFGDRFRAEQRLLYKHFGRDHIVQQLFVLGELTDQREHDRNILDRRRPNMKVVERRVSHRLGVHGSLHRRASSATISRCRMAGSPTAAMTADSTIPLAT